ncbi:MAG: hypothetical protein LBR58_09575 [Propionibacteriaceae bacterium]|nr:hypothetical protein [Propionibacteriaceae bacterium]
MRAAIAALSLSLGVGYLTPSAYGDDPPTTPEPSLTAEPDPAEEPAEAEPGPEPEPQMEAAPATQPSQRQSAPMLGATSDPSDINSNLTVNLTVVGSDQVLTGSAGQVKLEVQAKCPNGTDDPCVSMDDDAGILIVLPAYLDGDHTDSPLSGDAYTQVVSNYTVPGTSVTLPKAFLIWKKTDYGATYMPNLRVEYLFDNGTTPDGTQIELRAWVFEAEGIPSAGQPGTGIVETSGHGQSGTVTLTAVADEQWSVSKTVDTPTSAADQVFSSLRARAYADVATDGDAEDSYTITYKLAVASNKNSSGLGRLKLEGLHVTDTISGYAADGAPTAIRVYLAGGGVIPATVSNPTPTSTQLDFDMPEPSPGDYYPNRDVYVDVTFDKDDYTNLRNQTPILAGPQQVFNQAQLTYTPVTTHVETAGGGNTAEVAFGWYQDAPALPSLAVSKQLSASGETRNYTTGLARAWEDNAYADGSQSKVTFKLVQVEPGTATPVFPEVSYEQHVTLGAVESLATFTAVEPGSYKLYELGDAAHSINTDVTWQIPYDSIDNAADVVVSEPDPGTGMSTITVNGQDYTPSAARFLVANEATSHGFVRVYPKKQKAFIYPDEFETWAATLGLYAQIGDPAPLFTGTSSAAHSDSNGWYIDFELVPLHATYYVGNLTSDATQELHSVEPGTTATPALTDVFELETGDGSELNVYTAFFKANYGGFRAGKLLQLPDGTLVNENADGSAKDLNGSAAGNGSFAAHYKLYPFENGVCASDPLEMNGQVFTFTLTSNQVNWVAESVLGGTYCVREYALEVNGVDASDRYQLYGGDDLRLTITKGEFDGHFYSADASLVNPQPATTGVDSDNIGIERHVNKSSYGALAIQNFNAAGNVLSGTFTIEKTTCTADDVAWDNDCKKDVTVGVGGVYTEFVPDGTYTITAKPAPTGGYLWATMGSDNAPASPGATVQVTVDAGVNAVAAASVVSGVITPGASVQTGVFVWKFLPKAAAKKVRHDNAAKTDSTSGMTAAKFSLYKLDGADYTLVATAAVDASGNITLPAATYLTAGDYALAETALPSANFVAPDYFDVFVPGGTVATSVPAGDVPAHLKFQVTTADYHDTTVQTIDLGKFTNVPKNTLNLTKVVSGTTTKIGNISFSLCSDLALSADCATQTTDSNGRADFAGLAPGTYYVGESNAGATFVPNAVRLRVSIDSDGYPTFSWVDADGAPATPQPSSTVSFAPTASNGTTQVTTAVTVGNTKKVSIGFVKYGLVNEWNNAGERQRQPLLGAGFILSDDLGNYYELDGQGNIVETATVPSTVAYASAGGDCADLDSVTCSDGNGRIDFGGLDPYRTYTLTEVFVPEIPQDSVDGLEYEPLQVTFHFAWVSNKWVAVRGDDPDDTDAWAADSDGRHALLNQTDAYHIDVYKLPIKLADGETVENGFAADGAWDDFKVLDAKFCVYAYDDLATDKKGQLIETMTIGKSSVDGSNSGRSTELPAGKYVVEECQAALFNAPVDSWGGSGGYGLANPQGDQTTSVYYQVGETPDTINPDDPADMCYALNPSCDGGWMPGNAAQPPASAIIEISDENVPVTFGNSNRLAAGDGMNESRMVSWYGEKAGYRLNPLTGRYELDEPAWRLGGITFDVYPAYVDANGKYVKLPTVGDGPLTTITSNVAASELIKEGQFLTDYFDIAGVFACGKNVGDACADWDTAGQWVAPGVWESDYAQYGADGKVNAPGPVTIDWSRVSAALRHELANSYTTWSVVFVEQPKTSGCPGASPCSPLPEGYEFDPANPPEFGVTIENAGELVVRYYDNGNSAAGTDPADSDPEPVRFANYKGTGFVRLAKLGDNGTSATTDDAQVAGSAFEFYLADPEYPTDISRATKVTADRNGVSLDPYTNANANQDLKLQAGVYLLVEVTAPANHNAYGTFTSDAAPNSDVAFDHASNQNAAWDKSGSYALGGVIGPVVVPQNTEARLATRVTVTDKLRPSAVLANTWGGAEVSATAYSADYTYTTPGGSATITSAGVGLGLDYLADGDYTIQLDSISQAVFFYPNTAAQGEITFTVAGTLLTSSLKVNGVAMPTTRTAGLAADGVWYTVESGKVVIHVNHPAKGQLVIVKGGSDHAGVKSAPPAGLDSATFSYQCVDAAGNDAATCGTTNSGTITWTPAQVAAGGARIGLDNGLYRVQETGLTEAVAGTWLTDPNPVYIKINGVGAVWLVNRPASGAGSSAANPLLQGTDAATFYNPSALGDFEIKKFAAKPADGVVNTANLPGAEFDLYPTDDGTTPSGSALQHIVASGGRYQFTARAGQYLLKETKAPTGYGMSEEYLPITVLPGQGAVYTGYANGVFAATNQNVAVVLDPPALTLKVAKEVTYNAVGTEGEPGYIAARTSRVVALPITLWLRVADGDNAQANFEEVATVNTKARNQVASADLTGISPFTITKPGEYRVTEVLTSSHGHLETNPAYKVDGGVLGTADSIIVEYDADTNSLYVANGTVGDDHACADDDDSGWSCADQLLTINNPFHGYVIIVEKFDGVTGELVTVDGAKFGLYTSYEDALADGTSGRQELVADGQTADPVDYYPTGIVVFQPDVTSVNDPRLVDGKLTWWVREEVAPSGYGLDPWYDDIIKKVEIDPASGVGAYVVRFYDGKADTPSLTLDKTVSPDQAAQPLNRSGFEAEYTLTPNAPQNVLPLFNYTLTDGSLVFRGTDSGPSPTQIDVPSDADNPAPGYSFSQVVIGASTSYHSAEALAADDTDHDGAPDQADNAEPVYARVNGGAWTLLDVERTFTVTGDELKIEYADAIPASGEPASVGAYFTPGDVVATVAFDVFVPTAEQPEVSLIRNTAQVSACLRSALDGDGVCLDEHILAADDSAEVEVPVYERPVVSAAKVCSDDKCTGTDRDTGQPLDSNQRKFFAGQTVEFTLTAANAADPDLPFTAPVLIDRMDPAAFSMLHVGGEPVYTVYVDDVEYLSPISFTERGSVVIWEFPADFELAPGSEIKIVFTAKIADVITTNFPINELFVTSATTPLLPSSSYPTGASFTVADMSSNDAVYHQTWGSTPAPAREENWATVDAALQGHADNYGLFARAATAQVTVNSSGDIRRAKAVKVSDGDFIISDNPVDVSLNDEVTFRLMLWNAQEAAGGEPENWVTNIRIADVLPFADDGRGTTWDAALTDAWTYQAGSLRVYTQNTGDVPAAQYQVYSSADPLASGVAMATQVADWGAGNTGTSGITADATSFAVNMGDAENTGDAPVAAGFRLAPGDILFVEYTMEFSGLDAAAQHALLLDNNHELAANTFSGYFQAINDNAVGTDVSVTSNKAKLELRADVVSIAGVAWDDTANFGVRDASETLLAGVPVKLYSRIGGVESEVVAPLGVTFPTQTDASGAYLFAGLPASYGDGSEIEYQVRFGTPAGDWEYTLMGVGPETTDSDVHPDDDTAAPPEFAKGSTDWVKVYTGQAVLDAGLFRPASISGVVWEDLDDDGIQDDSPLTGHDLSNVLVTLTGGPGAPVQIAANSDGSYLFSAVLPGDYTVTFDMTGLEAAYPNLSYEWSNALQGVDPDVDSDAVAVTRTDVTATTAEFTVDYAGDVEHLDAGLVPYLHISGFAWLDINSDGEWQGGPFGPGPEEPFENVRVRLYRHDSGGLGAIFGAAGETLVAETYTDVNGAYIFDGLLYSTATQYKVVFDNPDMNSLLFTVAGVHHSATNVVAASGGRQREASTAYAMSPTAHFEGVYNAGFRELLEDVDGDGDGRLPYSGFDPLGWLAAAFALLVAGIYLVRSRSQHPRRAR